MHGHNTHTHQGGGHSDMHLIYLHCGWCVESDVCLINAFRLWVLCLVLREHYSKMACFRCQHLSWCINLVLWSDSSCCVHIDNKRLIFYYQTQLYIIQITSYTFWLVTKLSSGLMWSIVTYHCWTFQNTKCLLCCGKTVTQKLCFIFIFTTVSKFNFFLDTVCKRSRSEEHNIWKVTGNRQRVSAADTYANPQGSNAETPNPCQGKYIVMTLFCLYLQRSKSFSFNELCSRTGLHSDAHGESR